MRAERLCGDSAGRPAVDRFSGVGDPRRARCDLRRGRRPAPSGVTPDSNSGTQPGQRPSWHVVCLASPELPGEVEEAWKRCAGGSTLEPWAAIAAPSSGAELNVATTPWGAAGEAADRLTILTLPTAADDRLLALLELAAAALRWGEVRGALEGMGHESRAAAALVDLIARVSACQDLQRAHAKLANELQRYLGCSHVILGTCTQPDEPCRIAAVAAAKSSVPRPEDERLMRAALDEVLVRGVWVAWPAANAEDRPGQLALEKLARTTGAESLFAGPLRDEAGSLQGAWIFLGDRGFAECAGYGNFLRAAERPAATCLRLQRRAQRGWPARAAARLLAIPTRAPGRAALGAAVLLLVALAIPSTYRVSCHCELQPVIRRYVAAPFDGKLETSLVEPGDVVVQNQILARMDGRELRWELAGVAADLAKADKQVDGFLASGEFGSAEIAKFEVERLTLKMRLLEHRSENLEIRSPIDGIVIGGDLKRAEGAPVQVGQTLFEVAPLASMDVEIEIPGGEIAFVERDRSVEVVLDAFPGKIWSGRLERIHPRSETRREAHVFIGEMTLRSPDGKLRPGMQGRGKIAGPRRSWGWILFHKPWEKLALQWSW